MARRDSPPRVAIVAGKRSLAARLLSAVPLTLCLVAIVLGLVTALNLEPPPPPAVAPGSNAPDSAPAPPAGPFPAAPQEPLPDISALPLVEPFAGPPREPAPPLRPARTCAPPPGYWVEFAAYARPRYAKVLRRALAGHGIEAVIVPTHRPDGHPLTRVRSRALRRHVAVAVARAASRIHGIAPVVHRAHGVSRSHECWTERNGWANDTLAVILTPIASERLPIALASLATNLDPWANAVLRRIAQAGSAERADEPSAATHHGQAVAVLRAVGLGLRAGRPGEDFSWDGHAVRTGTEACVLLHEAAHFQLAAPQRRNRIDFGLGPGPETGNRRAAADAKLLFGAAREREEAMASLLGILWEVELGHPALASFLDQNWLEGADRPGTADHFRTMLQTLQHGGFITGDGRPTRFLRTAPDEP